MAKHDQVHTEEPKTQSTAGSHPPSGEDRAWQTQRQSMLDDTGESTERKGRGKFAFDGTSYPPWLGFDPHKKLDEPFAFPFPSVKGDPWEKVTEMVKRHDDHMCEAWVEEIQNILIFAGLFSAVVTAFAVETQKLLQPDPNLISAALLAQIAGHLTANTSHTTNSVFDLQPSTSVPFQSLRINILIFISLVIALGTALVGILALQWIRSYKRQKLRSHEDQLCIRQSRYQAFVDWKVPQIIAALPVVLQIALVLFFIGLVDFLKSLHSVVAIITGVVVGVILGVVVFTSVVPALYSFLSNGPTNRLSSSPPYCSPQSWLLYSFSVRIWNFWWLLRGQYFWKKRERAASWDELNQRRDKIGLRDISFGAWLSPALNWVFRNLTTTDSFHAAYGCFQTLPENRAEELIQDHLWSVHTARLQTYKALEPASYRAMLSLYALNFPYDVQHRHSPRDIYHHALEFGIRALSSQKPRYDDDGNHVPNRFPLFLVLPEQSFVLRQEPQERNMWLCTFLVILRTGCIDGAITNNIEHYFEHFWSIMLDVQGTEVGDDSIYALQDWIKSVPTKHRQVDRIRLQACIVALINCLPSNASKNTPIALEFCQSTAFLRCLDCFVDDPDVHALWLEVAEDMMAEVPDYPRMERWDQFLVRRLHRKYWVLGSTQAHLHHLEQRKIIFERYQLSVNTLQLARLTPPSVQSLLPSDQQSLAPITDAPPSGSSVILSTPSEISSFGYISPSSSQRDSGKRVATRSERSMSFVTLDTYFSENISVMATNVPPNDSDPPHSEDSPPHRRFPSAIMTTEVPAIPQIGDLQRLPPCPAVPRVVAERPSFQPTGEPSTSPSFSRKHNRVRRTSC